MVVSIPVWYNNYGTSTATNTKLTLTLDSDLVYVDDDAIVDPTVVGNVLTWDFGDLELSGGGQFEVQVAVPDDPFGTIYTSDLEITSDGPESDPDDNSASVIVAISASNYIYLPIISR
jgi:hypothetical protein